MKITRISRIAAISAVAALALAGCASNEAGGSTSEQPNESNLTGELVGAGSSAQEVAVQAWSAGFQMLNEGVTVSYDPSGSGAGRVSARDARGARLRAGRSEKDVRWSQRPSAISEDDQATGGE